MSNVKNQSKIKHLNTQITNSVKLKLNKIQTLSSQYEKSDQQVKKNQDQIIFLKNRRQVKLKQSQFVMGFADQSQIAIKKSPRFFKQQNTKDQKIQSLKYGNGKSEYNLFNNNTFPVSKQKGFKNIIKKHKIHNLINHFLSKIKRTSVYRKPIVFQPFEISPQIKNFLQGFQLHQYLQYIFSTLSIIITYLNCFIATLSIVFQQQIQKDVINYMQIFSIFWFFLQMVLGFLLVKQQHLKKIFNLSQITKIYIKSYFLIDFLCFFSVIFCYFKTLSHFSYIFYLVVFLKLPQSFKKFKKLQNKLIEFFYQEQHWGLIKMFLTNFVIAHGLAIILILMSNCDHNHNWIINKGLQNADWLQKYTWALYWGTTVMLSIGFGDIVATNQKQAMVLVFVQIVSCLALAYNINCIGELLAQIREKQQQKQQKIKILNQICHKNQIQRDLQFKLNSHILQSYQMKNKLKFDQYFSFIHKLPRNLKQQFFRQSNRKLLENLSFLRNFTNKTILFLAQKLEQKLIQPWEVAFKPQLKQIVLLKEGKIALCPNFRNNKFGQVVIQEMQANHNQTSLLLSLQFINRYYMTRNYDYRSVGYSIISYISFNQLQQVLKRKKVDFQFYFSFRDKERKSFEQYQIFLCKQCKYRHSKFSCPLLHFMPIEQQIIYKHINNFNNSKTIRRVFQRSKYSYSSLKLFQANLQIMELNSQTIDKFWQESKYSCRLTNKNISLKNVGSSICNTKKQQKTIQMITQEIKQQVMGFLQAEKMEAFWALQSDKAQDYQYYFIDCNPKRIAKVQLRKTKCMAKTNKRLQMSSRAKTKVLLK